MNVLDLFHDLETVKARLEEQNADLLEKFKSVEGRLSQLELCERQKAKTFKINSSPEGSEDSFIKEFDVEQPKD